MRAGLLLAALGGAGASGTECQGIWASGAIPDALRRRLGAESPELLERVAVERACPYGAQLPGQVTWPSPPDELEGVVAALSPLKVVAVFYAYVPYVVGAFLAVAMLGNACASLAALLRRCGSRAPARDGESACAGCSGRPPAMTTRHLWVAIFLVILTAFQELAVKRLLSQPRPGMMLQLRDYDGLYVGSCLASCGMPSSHSILSVGWFTLLFWDAAFRVHPEGGPGGSRGFLHHLRVALRLRPWPGDGRLTHGEFVFCAAFWGVVLLPVPFMRVVLYDHSVEQVTLGSILGFVYARVYAFYWRFLTHLIQPERPRAALEFADARGRTVRLQRCGGRALVLLDGRQVYSGHGLGFDDGDCLTVDGVSLADVAVAERDAARVAEFVRGLRAGRLCGGLVQHDYELPDYDRHRQSLELAEEVGALEGTWRNGKEQEVQIRRLGEGLEVVEDRQGAWGPEKAFGLHRETRPERSLFASGSGRRLGTLPQSTVGRILLGPELFTKLGEAGCAPATATE